MLDLILLDLDEVLVLTPLLIDLNSVLLENASLSSPELARFLSLLVDELLIASGILKHFLRILVPSCFKLFVVLFFQCPDLFLEVFLNLSFPCFKLFDLVPGLKLVAGEHLVARWEDYANSHKQRNSLHIT